MNRNDHLPRLRSEVFDLCIIGGGASGAGCALDAALRGLKVALVEKSDFAAGTSSRSTKLIHGGVRYLEQAFKNLDFAQLRQVRHGLEERHILLANAPHLAHPLAILTPVFSWWEGLYLRIGLWLYDHFAARKDDLPASRWLSRAEARQRMPGLSPQIHSAVLYYDGQLDDARYALALVQSAAAAGAAVANHLEVTAFQNDPTGKLTSITLQDQLIGDSFQLQARQFLNCTGPFADTIRQLANPALPPRIRPSKGVHVVLPKTVLKSADAMLIPRTPDGRVVFAIPFEGRLLLGTTDQDYPATGQEPLLENA
ncbi:MAG: FAD-dependent oxidoreductase, partial [Saprospiraceae bacterium]